MSDSKALTKWAKVFHAYDQGAHKLPADLVTMRDRVSTLTARCRSFTAPAVSVYDAEVLAAGVLVEGGALDVAGALAAADEHTVYEHSARVLRMARESAEARLTDLLLEQADVVVTDYLRPAHDEVIAAARKAVAAYRGRGTTASALLNAPQSARTGFAKLEALARNYSLILQTRSALRAANNNDQPRDDVRGYFSTVRNTDKLWPSIKHAKNVAGASTPPWPEADRRAYLEWMVMSGAEPWLPTVAEQDARFREVFAEGIAAAKDSNWRARSARTAW